MTIAILYATRYGATREAAEAIAARCRAAGSQVELVEIDRGTVLPAAESIVIGAPVYGGKIPRQVSRFVESNMEALLTRHVRIYLCCFYDGLRARMQYADNFPTQLIAHSAGHYFPGGRVKLAGLRWLDRLMIKRIGGVSGDVDKTNPAEIERLAADLLT